MKPKFLQVFHKSSRQFRFQLLSDREGTAAREGERGRRKFYFFETEMKSFFCHNDGNKSRRAARTVIGQT